MAEEMLFWRSWFFPTESSSSEENEGKVSRFLFSSSSKRLGLGQLPKASPPLPSLSPNGGGGGGGGGAGERGRKPPALHGDVSTLSGSIPGEMSNPGGRFPVLRKSRNEATKPALDSESLSSPWEKKKKKTQNRKRYPVCRDSLHHCRKILLPPLPVLLVHLHPFLHLSSDFWVCSYPGFWCFRHCRGVRGLNRGRELSQPSRLTKQGQCQTESLSSARHPRTTGRKSVT